MPLRSKNKVINLYQPDFQMRITVDNGEPGLPLGGSTVYKPVEDKKRFSNQLQPYQDVYRENICQSFISVKSSRILQR